MGPTENQLESVAKQRDESTWHAEEIDAGEVFVADLFSAHVLGWIVQQLPAASVEPVRRVA